MAATNTPSKSFALICAVIISYALIFIDESGIAVTLTTIQHQLHLSNNALHWIVNSYLLVFSVLLLFGGRLADLYGANAIFRVGVIIFMVASLACGLAHSATLLILARIAQGIGASLLMPCIILLLQNNIAPDSFGKVFGSVIGAANLFYAIGPLVAGVITEFSTWRCFFLINIPLAMLCLWLLHIAKLQTQTPHAENKFSDKLGLITFTVMLSSVITLLMEAHYWGWQSTASIGLAITAMISLSLFIRIEQSHASPLLDLRLFTSKQFSACIIILFCAASSLTSIIFWSLWLERSLGFSPAKVGLALLPATIFFIFVPNLAGRWQTRSGARAPIITGAALIFASLTIISVTLPLNSYGLFALGMAIFGIGIPLTIPCSYMAAVATVDASKAGMASGTVGAIRQIALSVGMALLTLVVSSSAIGLSTTANSYTQTLQTGMYAMSILSLVSLLVAILIVR